jgi:hypothetical protein
MTKANSGRAATHAAAMGSPPDNWTRSSTALLTTVEARVGCGERLGGGGDDAAIPRR